MKRQITNSISVNLTDSDLESKSSGNFLKILEVSGISVPKFQGKYLKIIFDSAVKIHFDNGIHSVVQLICFIPGVLFFKFVKLMNDILCF